MGIILYLKESVYDCKIIITDSHGERYYNISAVYGEERQPSSIVAEVYDNEFSLCLIPMMAYTKSDIDEWEPTGLKDKLAKKASKFLLSAMDKMILRVGCTYHIVGLEDGDRLDITLQSYAFGTFDRFDILELLPMCYTFFEVSNFNDYYKLTDAYETNRKDVLKFAKTLSLADMLGNELLFTIFTYPIQVLRIKHLTKNKKIFKVLTRFNNLDFTEKQRFIEKQGKVL